MRQAECADGRGKMPHTDKTKKRKGDGAMEKTVKNQVWNFNDRIDAEVCAEGVERKILAYTDELMCVENHFKKGAVGALHHHPLRRSHMWCRAALNSR